MGLQKKNGENCGDCEQKMKKIFIEKLQLDNNIIIQGAHRAKKANMERSINHEQ